MGCLLHLEKRILGDYVFLEHNGCSGRLSGQGNGASLGNAGSRASRVLTECGAQQRKR
jgi:hypothetical protein